MLEFNYDRFHTSISKPSKAADKADKTQQININEKKNNSCCVLISEIVELYLSSLEMTYWRTDREIDRR